MATARALRRMAALLGLTERASLPMMSGDAVIAHTAILKRASKQQRYGEPQERVASEATQRTQEEVEDG